MPSTILSASNPQVIAQRDTSSVVYRNLRFALDGLDTVRDMDPVRNPYAPGAGQRPPELAGRDTELAAFDVALERVERGRPERSLVLTGLRGVGKTVLLNALRSKALDRGWGTGKVEARPDTSLRRPLTGALHAAVRELSVRHRAPDRVREVLATLKAFGLRSNPRGGKLIERWTPAIDGPPSIGRADSGDMEIDLLELLTDVAGLAADVGVGVAVFIDEMQDLTPTDVSALCASCHELSQTGAPLMVVGAGLPHLPSVLSASKSYSRAAVPLRTHRPAGFALVCSGHCSHLRNARVRPGRPMRLQRWA